MKIKLIFTDWRQDGHSIYSTEKGVKLSTGQFHSGTTFNGTINLDAEDEAELKKAIKEKYHAIFEVSE